jgi:alpha-tubulin suppressor-like RCC1 family protein
MTYKGSIRWLIAAVSVVFGAACLESDTQFPDHNGDGVDTVTFRSVDAGAAHTCGVVEGDVGYCWGNNSVGQLGSNDIFSYAIPKKVAQGDLEFVHVSAGVLNSCAVTIDQEVYCWGHNQYGQVGSGTAEVTPTFAPSKVLGDHQFTTVSAGGAHVCGLVGDGEAWCWGLAGSGALGNGSSGDDTWSTVPVSVLTAKRFRAISAGIDHTCGVTADGEAYCWGENSRGQLGNGTTTSSAVPVQVVGGLLFEEIDAGYDHTCALDLEGNAFCWGGGFYGQLGSDAVSSSTPLMVSGGLTFQAITAGANYTCAIDAGSAAYCWGLNDDGRLGDGTRTLRREPTAVSGNLSFDTISAGEGGGNTATCGFTQDNLVYCWGHGAEGQLGTGLPSSSNVPILVIGQG